MANNIKLETIGILGGAKRTQKVGFVTAILRHDEDKITIDDFEGNGKTYKQRELQHIEVIQNGQVLFSGNKYELFEILKGK